MATKQGTIDYLLEQLTGAGDLTTRKMFGEYALYYEGKVIAFICDDQLFLKPTESARALLTEVVTGKPYPGAKDYFLITADEWEDAEKLTELIQATAAALPPPTPKKARKRKTNL